MLQMSVLSELGVIAGGEVEIAGISREPLGRREVRTAGSDRVKRQGLRRGYSAEALFRYCAITSGGAL